MGKINSPEDLKTYLFEESKMLNEAKDALSNNANV
jgi:hypothetical protein